GEMTKAEVRAEAAALGLRTAAKPESMEVCFITRGGRERFLAGRGAMRAGDVVDAASGAVTVGPYGALLRDEVRLSGLTWVGEAPPDPSEAVLVQVRAHGAPFEGTVDGDRVRFARPQPRVAPGQVVALYRGDTVLGGGIAV